MNPSAGNGSRAAHHGFTLLELTISILVIAIVITMLFPVFGSLRSRSERIRCIANLRSLHVAASLYVQEHKMWPQIAVNSGSSAKDNATQWIDAFQPYGLAQINWICPTIQRSLQSPNFSDPDNTRIDYAASNFDTNQQSPYQYSTQPWFVESADVHGNGNLLIFPDGSIQTLNELLNARN